MKQNHCQNLSNIWVRTAYFYNLHIAYFLWILNIFILTCLIYNIFSITKLRDLFWFYKTSRYRLEQLTWLQWYHLLLVVEKSATMLLQFKGLFKLSLSLKSLQLKMFFFASKGPGKGRWSQACTEKSSSPTRKNGTSSISLGEGITNELFSKTFPIL